MTIELWNGMVEVDPAPGNVWWHATVVEVRENPDGSQWSSPQGIMFESPADAQQSELVAAANRRWKEVLEKKYKKK